MSQDPDHFDPDPPSPAPISSTIDCQLFGGSLDGLLLPLKFDPANALIPFIISTGAGDYTWLPEDPNDRKGRPAYRLMSRVS